MNPVEILRKTVRGAVCQTIPGVTQGQCTQVQDRVVKWLDQGGCRVVAKERDRATLEEVVRQALVAELPPMMTAKPAGFEEFVPRLTATLAHLLDEHGMD